MAQIKSKFITDSAVTTAKIANNAVDNTKLAQIASQTFKGRTTAGTGNVEDLTATQATAILNNFVGDSGSGGTKGLVPAPAAGDSAANKFLKADGTWESVASTSEFLDSEFRINDDGDPTKQIAFEAAGITTSTTRTISMPDADVDLGEVNTSIQQDGSRDFNADQSMGSNKLTDLAFATASGDALAYEQAVHRDSGSGDFTAQSQKITNLADPTSAQEAATKAYVDAVAEGLKPKQAVRAGTLVPGVLLTDFEDGDVIDGVTLATDDRILIKDQLLPAENGIYIVQASGSPVRAPDFDSLSPIDEINGAYTFVQEGTQAGQGWVQQGVVSVIGTDPINFVYFNSVAGIVGGDMITVTGSTISVDLATVSGLESTNPGNDAGQLRIKLEASNPSLQFSGSNELGLKIDASGGLQNGASGVSIKSDTATANTIGVTSTSNGAGVKFDSNSFADGGSETLALASGVAGSGLALTTGVLSVNVDGSTLEINADTLRVKDAGITLAKLASNSVDENKIVSTSFNAAGAVTGGSGTKIAVQVDNSTIEISANALRIKDAGVTLAKLASNSVDENKIVSTTISTTGALNGGSGTKLSSRVDATTVKINGSNNLEGLKHLEQQITLSGTDITNQYVDLSFAIWGSSASVNSASLFVIGGPMQQKTVDYTVSLTGGSGGVTRITFAGDLATGGNAALIATDILVISYDYLT